MLDCYAILDNASNQSTELVHNCLKSVFGPEQYKHLPAYSPFLAPAERGFANIRSFVKEHESGGVTDPIGLIQEAFRTYSVGGERTYNHFNLYDEKFEQWPEDEDD